MKLCAIIAVVVLARTAWPAPACHIVQGERILAADLAAALPAFAALPAGTDLGPAPAVGAHRVFRPGELLRMAGSHGIPATGPAGVCFERASQFLTREKLVPLLQKSLARDGGVEVEDFSRSPLPLGELEFLPAGLSPTGLWRGRVKYGEARGAPIWVKVHLIESQGAMASGTPESKRKAVDRGDPVRVEIRSGLVRLSFEAQAESAGSIGEMVLLKNPLNGQRFQARVEGKGKVSVKK
jgi:hypothetical protein